MEKFWTDAKITETLSKERVLKPLPERKPKTWLTSHSLAKLVSQKNGFLYENVREVVDDLMEVMWDQMLLGHKVNLTRIGQVYLHIAPPYSTNINLKGLGGVLKPHLVPPRIGIKFTRNEASMFFLKQREVSEAELDSLYISDTDEKKEEVGEILIKESKEPGSRKM